MSLWKMGALLFVGTVAVIVMENATRALEDAQEK